MSGYEHDHEHGHFQPHTHPHRHLGEQPTEAHERSGMGAHHHQHTARPAVPSLDPYSERGEHERQSLAGTHNFDPQCPFCFFDAFDAEKRAEYALATPATGLNKDRVTIRINTFVNGVALGRSTQITVKHDDEVNIDFPINLDTLLRDGLQDGVRVTAINTVPINCECPGRQFNMHLDGCPYREAKPFA